MFFDYSNRLIKHCQTWYRKRWSEIMSLRELKGVIGAWREYATSSERGTSPRVAALLAFLDDAKNLGF